MLWGPAERAAVFDGLPAPRRAADLGCGRGLMGRLLLQRFGTVRVDGYDLDPGTVAAGRRSPRPPRGRLTFNEGDVCDLDVRDASYDLVVGQAVLVHQSRPDRVVAEALRLVRPGGRVLFVEPDVPAAWRALDPTPDGVVDPWPEVVAGARASGAGDWALVHRWGELFEAAGAVDVQTTEHPGRHRTSEALRGALLALDPEAERDHLELLGMLHGRGGGGTEAWTAYVDALGRQRRDRAAALRAGAWTVDAWGGLHVATASKRGV